MGVVAGLDLSFTCTGIAMFHSDGRRWTRTVKSTGKANDNLETRAARIRKLFTEITHGLDDVELVLIESPSFGSAGSGTWDRAGLWWMVVGWLQLHDIPVAMVAPTTLKKWATGSGTPARDASLTKPQQAKAGKKAVQDAVRALLPDLELKTNDESDAACMAHMGAFKLGFVDTPLNDWHTEANLAAVKWPEALGD